jgi:hypothetical protein
VVLRDINDYELSRIIGEPDCSTLLSDLDCEFWGLQLTAKME